MAGWHHWLDGRESEWTPGIGDGQGGLACCDSWGRKESDTTEWLNWTELKSNVTLPSSLASQLLQKAGILRKFPWITSVGIGQCHEWIFYRVALIVNLFFFNSMGLWFLLKCPHGETQLMWFSFLKDYSVSYLVLDSGSSLLLHSCFLYFFQVYICLMRNVLSALEPEVSKCILYVFKL